MYRCGVWRERRKPPEGLNLPKEGMVTITTGLSTTMFSLREEFLLNLCCFLFHREMEVQAVAAKR
jgi:hypothetical protein